jgi:hypothetical protein
MKYDKLDIVFFISACLTIIMVAVVEGLNNCRTSRGETSLFVIPFAVMVGVYFWRRGKEMGKKK